MSLIGALQETAERIRTGQGDRATVVLREARVALALAFSLQPARAMWSELEQASESLEQHGQQSAAWADQIERASDVLWTALISDAQRTAAP